FIKFFGKKLGMFLLYTGMFFSLSIGFIVGINHFLDTIGNNLGSGFTELNQMLPTGTVAVLSFYFSSKAVMWTFLAQYKLLRMKSILIK
ncbi:hypothetical protein, partial [Photobacterium leiognathi]